MAHEDSRDNCFTVEGRMALPNTYFAGRVGSRFIISIRDRRQILGVRCVTCSKVYVPPREYCERCLGKLDDNWVNVSSEGEITNFTVIHYNERHLPRKAPYVLALIKLDGADTPFVHIVEKLDPEDVTVGMRVKAVFATTTTNTLLDIDHFEPL